jgi:hypothetical protein
MGTGAGAGYGLKEEVGNGTGAGMKVEGGEGGNGTVGGKRSFGE